MTALWNKFIIWLPSNGRLSILCMSKRVIVGSPSGNMKVLVIESHLSNNALTIDGEILYFPREQNMALYI
jgi:hypothetical protein